MLPVTAGMKAAEACGKHLGRPPTAPHVVSAIVELATSTDLSVRQIRAKIAGRSSRTVVGEIAKRARSTVPAALCPLFTRILSLPRLRSSYTGTDPPMVVRCINRRCGRS